MSEHTDKLRKGIALLHELHECLIDLEVMLQMELANSPADSGFEEAMDDVRENWSRFNKLFEEE